MGKAGKRLERLQLLVLAVLFLGVPAVNVVPRFLDVSPWFVLGGVLVVDLVLIVLVRPKLKSAVDDEGTQRGMQR